MTPADSDGPALPSSWEADESEALAGERKARKWFVIAGVVVALLVVTATVLIVQRAFESTERAWPESTSGRPPGLGGNDEKADAITLEAEPGIYIWQSFDGWHLWAVNGGDVAGVSGTITSSDDIVSAEPSGEGATVSTDGKEITLELTADAAVAGVDFDAGFSKELTFDLDGPDGPIDPKLVTLGSDLESVSTMPLVIEKAQVD